MRIVMAGASGFLGGAPAATAGRGRARGRPAGPPAAGQRRPAAVVARAARAGPATPSPAPTRWSTWPGAGSRTSAGRRRTGRCWSTAGSTRPPPWPRDRRPARRATGPASCSTPPRSASTATPATPRSTRPRRPAPASSPTCASGGRRRPTRPARPASGSCCCAPGWCSTAGGGLLRPLLLATRLCAGGPLGGGRQWMPWISMRDWVGAAAFLLDRDDVGGPVNLVGPAPVRNADFAQALGRALHRPAPCSDARVRAADRARRVRRRGGGEPAGAAGGAASGPASPSRTPMWTPAWRPRWAGADRRCWPHDIGSRIAQTVAACGPIWSARSWSPRPCRASGRGSSPSARWPHSGTVVPCC